MTKSNSRLKPLYPTGVVVAATACLLLCLATQVQSQTASVGTTPVGSEGDQETSLEDIVVTARKRTETVLSIPVSITALSAAALEKADMQTAADLSQHVTGLQVQSPTGNSNPIFSLRGVSMNDYVGNQSSPIALYTDEVYRSGAVFWSDQLYDLERVEVLRGPQGTLYGKNATGGAINFISMEPGFTTGGYLSVGGGNYGRVEANGAYQLPISDAVAVRLAFDYKNTDGFIKNVYLANDNLGAIQEYGARLSILFRPTDDLKAILRFASSTTGPSPYPDHVYATSSGIGGGLYTQFHNLYPAVNPNTDYYPTFSGAYQTSAGRRGYNSSSSNDVSLNVHWDISKTLSLISVTAFNEGYFRYGDDSDGSPRDVLFFFENSEGHQFGEDVRLDYHGESVTGLLGLYYSDDGLTHASGSPYYADVSFDGAPAATSGQCLSALNLGLYPDGCTVNNRFHQGRKSEAVYADGSYAITNALSLMAGVRFTRDELYVSQYSAYTLGNDGVPLWNNIPTATGFGIPGSTSNVFATNPPTDDVWTKVSGRVGLNYTFSNGVLLYGVLSSGYRMGAVNANAYFQPSEVTIAQPESLDSLEFGVKGSFFEKRLQIETAAFAYQYKNQQAQSTNPINLALEEVNIGRSSLRGLDFEVTARPVPSLTMAANISYLHTNITEGEVTGVSIVGNHLPTAPTISGNFDLDWEALRTTDYTLTLSPSGSYRGPQYFFLGTESGFGATNTFGYWLFDARASLALNAMPLTISVWGKNLADKRYYSNVQYLTYYGIGPFTTVGWPRTFGIEVNYKL